jgi:hypothetical protein
MAKSTETFIEGCKKKSKNTLRPVIIFLVKAQKIQGVSKWLGINFRVNSLRKMWLKT